MSSQFEDIIFEEESNFAIITINRPKVYNALRKQSKLEIIKAIKMANSNSQIKSIIITAKGKAFCSGQDLNDRNISQSTDNPIVDLGHTLETEWNPLMKACRNSPKIIIGAINGVTAGAGLSLVLNFDFIYATSQTQFMSGFSKLGLVPDAGSTHTLTKILGKFRALDFFLLNNPLTSDEMLKYGILKDISDHPLELAHNLSDEISKLPPLSLKFLKSNIQSAVDDDYHHVMERESHAQRFLGHTDDYREGLQAFLEKRKANFQGH